MKKIHIEYFAMLREERGRREETVRTPCDTAADLYDEIAWRHGLRYPREKLKVAVNDEIRPWSTVLKTGDAVSFIPPVSGG